MLLDGGQAHPLAVAMLAAHVGGAAGIVADQHRGQARTLVAGLEESAHPLGELLLDGLRGGLAVEGLGSHGAPEGGGGVAGTGVGPGTGVPGPTTRLSTAAARGTAGPSRPAPRCGSAARRGRRRRSARAR